MRRLLPLLLLGLAGCYAPRAVTAGPDGYTTSHYGGGWQSEPLHASVWYDSYTGLAQFDVNRPAHVAIFALQPAGGLEMIYPAIGYGGRTQFAMGRHDVRTRGAHYRFASSWSTAYGASPTYIVMIASERPLDVAPFMATGSVPWLSRASLTWNPYHATEVLASQIVPQPNVTDWTVAYHVIWPDNGLWDRRDRRAYTWVRCPSGVIISVPVEALRLGWFACPEGTQTTPPDSLTRKLPKLTDALPKRPVPPGWTTGAADSVDVGTAVRRIAEQRREIDGLGGGGSPLPAWRRGLDKPDHPAGASIASERPVVIPELPARPARDPEPGVETAREPESPRTVVPAPRRVEPRPRAEPRPSTPRAEPTRSTPRAEPTRSTPRAEPRPAPTPRTRPAPSNAPSRPKPKPKPTGGGGGGGNGGNG